MTLSIASKRFAGLGLLTCFVFALCGSAPSMAHAQSGRVLFRRGSAAMGAGRFSEARDLFRAALEAQPNAGSAFNLSVAYSRTGEDVQAVEVLSDLLSGEYGRLSRRQRVEVRALHEEAEAAIAILTVVVPEIEGVQIRVDGITYDAPMRLNAGDHLITLIAPRYQESETRVRLNRGQREVLEPQLELRADSSFGRLVVDTAESEGLVQIIGETEALPRLDLRLREGMYELLLSAGDAERRQDILVEAGTTTRYTAELSTGTDLTWLWIASAAVLLAGGATAVALAIPQGAAPRQDAFYGTIVTLRQGGPLD